MSWSLEAIPRVLPSVASGLEQRALSRGLDRLRERKDLEPLFLAALADALPGLTVEKDRRVSVPYWSTVGNVDIVVWEEDELRCGVELKWGDHDKVYEGIWDLFKMALLGLAPSRPDTFLVMGAPTSAWNVAVGREVFETGRTTPEELCALHFTRRCAWDYLLQGGYDRYPEMVPSTIVTTLVGQEPVRHAGSEWELRAVLVVSAATDFVPFSGGWAHGIRPPSARHPLPI